MSDHNSNASKGSDLVPNSKGVEPEQVEETLNGTISAFDEDLQDALHSKDLGSARSIVADAEAVLAAHERATANEARPVLVPKPHLAGAKARIAMTAGDPTAARAILVQAIERWPDVPPLRAMMTEVMLASGRAKDVRPVLAHLGRQPTPIPLPLSSEQAKKDSTG